MRGSAHISDRRAAGRRNARGSRRGFGATPFLFESLGTSLTILQDRRGLPASAPVGTWTNLGPGKTADFTGITTARPGLQNIIGVPISAADFIGDLGGSDDLLSSTQTLAQTITAGVEWGLIVFDPDFVKGTSAVAWPNGCVIGDTGGFHGVFVRDTSGGLFGPSYEVQAYGFDGATKVAKLAMSLAKAPIAVEWVHTGGTLTITDIYTGATDSIACGNITTLSNTMRMGPGGTNRIDGRVAFVAVANAVPTTAYREAAKAKIRAEFPPQHVVSATTSNLWGNAQPARGLDASGGPVYWSPLSMLVIETDSPSVGAVTRESGTTVAEFSDAAILQGTTSQKYGTTEIKQIAATGATGRRDTGLVAGSGSGNRRYFGVGAPWSAAVAHHIEKLYVPFGYQATTSVVSQPATGTICVDGYGGRLAEDASDGIIVAAGVLDGGAGPLALRAAAAVRVALFGATHALVTPARNDRAAGTASTDHEVSLGAIVDILIAAGIAAENIKIVSNIKEIQAFPNTEPATIAAYRAVAATVTTAKSLATLIDGSALPDAFASMGTGAPQDGVHPMPAPQTGPAELAASFASWGTGGRLLVWTDSIFIGSTSPSLWNAVRGVVGLARSARA